jgi:hypothetical protein
MAPRSTSAGLDSFDVIVGRVFHKHGKQSKLYYMESAVINFFSFKIMVSRFQDNYCHAL